MSHDDLLRRLRESLEDTLLSDEERADLVASVIAKRPILIVGPRGTAKDMVATKIIGALGVHHATVNCSANLRQEDLFGEIDPMGLREFGYLDDRSYIQGVLEKATGGVAYLKDLDNAPEKVAEALANFLDDGVVRVGNREMKTDVSIIAIASSTEIDDRLLDRFNVVLISYPKDEEEERAFISAQSSCRVSPPGYVSDVAAKFLARSRHHPDIETGASTRSGIRFIENVCATMELSGQEPEEEDLYNSAYASFGHSIRLNPFSWKTNRELSRSIFQDAVMSAGKERGMSERRRRESGLRRYKIPIIVAAAIAFFAVGAFLMIGRTPPDLGIGSENITPPNLPEIVDLPKDTPFEGTPPDITELLENIAQELEIDPTELIEKSAYNAEDDVLLIQGDEGMSGVPYYSELLSETGDGDTIPAPADSDGRKPFGDFHPALLILSFVAIAFLSTFLFDYLDLGRRIRDSKFMETLRRRIGISWDPLTRLYRNISEETSPLSGRLEGDSLGQTVKEISTARDELYAERAKDRASLQDIADLVKQKPEKFPALSGLLDSTNGEDANLPPENRLMKELERHLVKEGLIKSTKGVSFTHRVSKFLVSDVDERILKRVYDALEGVSYEELPPLPSSDIKDIRRYRRGDSYKDIAIRESIRDAIRRRRSNVERSNLHVYEREAERREVVVQGDADVVVVLDLSGSMAYGDKLWYAKQAIVVMTIIAERYGNRVGVVGFRDLSTEVAELGAQRNATIAKVANLLPRGGTNIAAGIRRALDLLVGEVDVRKGESPDPNTLPERRKQLILLTDGDATHPKPKQFAAEYARRCARLAARYGVTISVVCIGEEDETSDFGRSYNPELAAQVAEIGSGSLFFVKDMRDLSSVFVAEIDKLMLRSSMVPAVVQTPA